MSECIALLSDKGALIVAFALFIFLIFQYIFYLLKTYKGVENG